MHDPLGVIKKDVLWEILKTKTSEMKFLEIVASYASAVLLTVLDLATLQLCRQSLSMAKSGGMPPPGSVFHQSIPIKATN